MIRDISAVTISDLHVFNNLNPTNLVVNHGISWLEDHIKTISKADVFFVAGDWFDRGIRYASPDVYLSIVLANKIGKICLDNNIKLRFLEGTKSHDMNQNQNLVNYLVDMYPALDVKLHKTICIEYIPDLDINVLFVPDDMGTADYVWKRVTEVLAEADVQAVDIACMHGCFEYHVAGIDSPHFHNEKLYLSIVRSYITIGHHHTWNVDKSGRIFTQGSLDRMSFGQPEEKGGVVVYCSTTGDVSYERLINTRATPFVKYVLTGDPTADEEAIRKITMLNDQLVHIRLIGSRDEPFLLSLRTFGDKYKHVKFSKEVPDISTADLTKSAMRVKKLPAITRDNFPEMLGEYLEDRNAPDREAIILTLRGFTDENND